MIWDLGYGSRILAESDNSLTGFDVDREALVASWRDYGSKEFTNLSYAEQHLEMPWPRDMGQADVMIAFDFFEESIRHRDLFLEHVVRHLRPDGRFLLNSAHFGLGEYDPYPKGGGYLRFNTSMLQNILSRYFKDVYIAAPILPTSLAHYFLQPVFKELDYYGDDLIYCYNPIKSSGRDDESARAVALHV